MLTIQSLLCLYGGSYDIDTYKYMKMVNFEEL